MEIKHILFDLDNTLYPATSAMDKGITTRMLECVADFFNCSIEKAIEIRKERKIVNKNKKNLKNSCSCIIAIYNTQKL